MVRPLRIEFEGAWYHVMNRGAGRRWIFKSDHHKQYFLSLLESVIQRFNIEVHAYCLMNNHYHLMIHTPEGNLQRVMRHINGVYTQYFNRSEKRDGSLFRGRYKAVLVDAQAYWLELSRYIHRNPVEAGVVATLDDYLWSSYPSYIGKVAAPGWLSMHYVLQTIGKRKRHERYRAFVEAGVSEEIMQFYGSKKQASILSGQTFKEQYTSGIQSDPEIAELKTLRRKPSAETIITRVAQMYGLEPSDLLMSRRGRAVTNPARNLAMYLCQEIGGMKLTEIATHFGLAGYASAGASIRLIRQKIVAGEEGKALNLILQDFVSLHGRC